MFGWYHLIVKHLNHLHSAVDYLSEGALTESMSYVFGPVLKLLRSVGYEDGVNLDAAPYDWRIPVSCLKCTTLCQQALL